jgi:hypothetical protein
MTAGRRADWVPLREAGRRMGCSVATARRRARDHTVHAEKRPTRRGSAWFVRVDSLLPPRRPPARPADTFAQVALLLGERIVALSARLDAVEARLARLDDPAGTGPRPSQRNPIRSAD